MARVVGKARPTVEGSTSMKLSEMIVIGFVVAGLIAGGIYYYQYRQKAPYALSSFLGAVNRGRVKEQFELLDDEDKALLQSAEKYETNDQVPLGLGYGERIPKFTMNPPVPYAKDPNAVSISTTLQVVDGGGTKELTQLAASKPYTDNFIMRKDKDGHWKVWLSETFRQANGKLHMMASPPSPRSTY
jgi:hypothetical protein